ncbi:MAG: PLP-dependent aminotransferase family protein [Gammaproteobacteria bacterium]|nr:PLP-dependent aminotransferase family protein [Gammaproteobacteria bacterium]
MENTLYNKIADQIIKQIKEGVYTPGDRLLSVRSMSKQQSVSVSTILASYGVLEERGFVEVRAKSGYYVRRSPAKTYAPPLISQKTSVPRNVTKAQRIMEVIRDVSSFNFINLASAVPGNDFPVIHQLKKTFSTVVRNQTFLGIGYGSTKGCEPLRRQLAKRSMDAGILVSPDEIVTTSGCQSALEFSLRALTKPGDIVAIETPCYYGLLQLIEACGLKAIEIPSDAVTGMSIEALELALEQWSIKVIISLPCYNNPMGSLMPDEHKRQIVELIHHYNIPLIEDDVYAELGYGSKRPRSIKSFDDKGQVVLCSSVSKTLDPGLRVGWVIPGIYQEKIEYQKFVSSVNVSRLPQLAVAELLSHGGYDRHLRLARDTYRHRRDQLLDLIDKHFPKKTRISKPQGGFVAWIQLPEQISVPKLYEDARNKGISFSPGDIFSSSNKYQSSIRLTYSSPWTVERVAAIKTLGDLVNSQM